ncbi:ArnT family glycosyltransferase [Rubripirellula reticaptiva]|uniref:Undecaprenyl phosphate-alpha-4-amino-4-deoxy-L-arabinose arabinosyl transferase n=1 Tax=Rubripirellula reticaptiva TaxID=2528013 RepID=A0A5C6EHC6_9BACT|nr:glycosyltransferase family 39 protein [Rubripirellula reticaptiva]TWU47884.1 Undecaprenyl phosphate-alpha-4-amino-4-deoxy-L-arabinose arabinosyl transferase [Rubripirellula reticaptiva]
MLTPVKTKIRCWWNETLFPIAAESKIQSKPWTKRQETIAMWVLVAASAAILMPSLSYPLIEPDETRYAQIAIEMNDSQNWITPTLSGQPYLDKPPLMYWLTALSFKCFGNTEMAARLPAVLASLATILVSFLLGKRILAARPAFLGSVALLLCGGFVFAGRFLILDSLLSFFVVTTLLSAYIAVRQESHHWGWWMFAGIACALGVLTKGPVALLLCGPPVVVSAWLRQDSTRPKFLHWAAFGAPIAIVCIPWYIAVWKSNPAFGDYFFLEHNLKRFTQGSNHKEPFWFYAPSLLAAMFPTSLVLPSLGFFLVGRSDAKRGLRSKDMGFLFLAAGWILLFFSLASCKLPTYILPALPLLCLMIGGMLDQTVLRPERENGISAYLKPFPQRASLILLFTLILVMSLDVWFGGTVSAVTIAAGIGGAAVLAVVLRYWNTDKAFSASAWAFTAAFAAGVISFTTARFVPTVAAERSVLGKVAKLTADNPNALVVFFDEKSHGAKVELPIQTHVHLQTARTGGLDRTILNHQELVVVVGQADRQFARDTLSSAYKLVAASDNDEVYVARRIKPNGTAQAVVKKRELH